MIRIGQAGIPLSCKGRTNKDGLVYTKKILDLNAMEVQFVRGLYVMDDEESQFMKEYATENDVELHVHHIKSWANNPDLRLDIDNAITLCVHCHAEAHGWCKIMKQRSETEILFSQLFLPAWAGRIRLPVPISNLR